MTLGGRGAPGSRGPRLKAPFLASAFTLDIEGWQPADPVFGTSVIQLGVGAQMCPLSPVLNPRRRYYRSAGAGTPAVGPTFTELAGYSGAVLGARRRALHDAVEQAASRGVHGVVGMVSSWRVLGAGAYQASWQGQAVRHPVAPPLPQPFSSTLGAAGLAKLLQSGFTPVAVVVGLSAVHVHAWATQVYWQGAYRNNYELPALAEALSAARHAALRSIRDDPAVRGAEVVVDLDLHMDMEATGCAAGQGGRLVTAIAVGTAAVRFGSPLERRPRLALVLGEGATP